MSLFCNILGHRYEQRSSPLSDKKLEIVCSCERCKQEMWRAVIQTEKFVAPESSPYSSFALYPPIMRPFPIDREVWNG